MGLSVFGGVLQEIMYFKPQVVYVSVMFLTVLAQALGTALSQLIPRKGAIGRFLNPFPWNRKEHTAAVLMASAASVSALSTEALSVQELWYGGYPSTAAGVFITLSSQLIGYGAAGIMRSVLLYPTKMLYPANLPITTVMETLHKPKAETVKRFKVFWIIFVAIFCWEWFPEYIFPILSAVSIFCLADQKSAVFTNLFGGSQGNEGMGFLNICFDWNYIAGFGSPLWMPLQTLTNSFIGYLGGIILSMGLYYSNIWRGMDFPFMSQLLYDGSSNSTNYVVYNETLIMNSDFTIDTDAVDKVGVPYLTATYVNYLITTNASLTATLVHMLLWNYDDVSKAWSWITLDKLKSLLTPSTYCFWKSTGARTEAEKEAIRNDPTIDPHYRLMVDYDEVPSSWYFVVFIISIIVGIVCLYVMKSTLPWWGFIIGTLLLIVLIIFFGAQSAITGFTVNMQPVMQMLAGYMFPGKPLGTSSSIPPPKPISALTSLSLSCSKHVLHNLHLQRSLSRDPPPPRPQTRPAKQTLPPRHLHHANDRVRHRRPSQLRNDDQHRQEPSPPPQVRRGKQHLVRRPSPAIQHARHRLGHRPQDVLHRRPLPVGHGRLPRWLPCPSALLYHAPLRLPAPAHLVVS